VVRRRSEVPPSYSGELGVGRECTMEIVFVSFLNTGRIWEGLVGNGIPRRQGGNAKGLGIRSKVHFAFTSSKRFSYILRFFNQEL